MRFAELFAQDGPATPVVSNAALDQLVAWSGDVRGFMASYSGCSFASGLYRVHRAQDLAMYTELAVEAFPAFKGRVVCFASDWLGRQFALDEARRENGEPLVLMLEPGTGEALEVPTTFAAFHEVELVQYTEAALAASFYKEWIAAGGEAPAYGQCVGYEKPLYLGGEDEVSNLRMEDMSVYWSISAQLLARTRGLPVGTPIKKVTID